MTLVSKIMAVFQGPYPQFHSVERLPSRQVYCEQAVRSRALTLVYLMLQRMLSVDDASSTEGKPREKPRGPLLREIRRCKPAQVQELLVTNLVLSGLSKEHPRS